MDDFITDNELVKSALSKFLRFSLWANKCDLSISAGFENSQKHSPVKSLEKLESNILIDDTENIWNFLNQLKNEKECPLKIGIILDNAGYEVITDLCLAEFLLASGLAKYVHFHGKNFPWFVSDVTHRDFKWTLNTLATSSNSIYAHFGKKWKQRIDDHSWKFSTHKFWTLPYDFNEMRNKFPDLFDQLSMYDFLIFKGDLNYRKLVGDINWEMTTPFFKGLREFQPTPLCVLRTIKSDTLVGLQTGVAEKVIKKDPKWLVNGNWGLICFSQDLS